MAALKMFFCIVSEARAADVTIHRELNSIYTLWNAEKSDAKIGIIHIGFTRPRVPSYDDLEHFYGTILVSAGAKWSLPEEYKTSNKAIFTNSKISLFQLITGFGYDIELAKDEFTLDDVADTLDPVSSDRKHTIASAALEVLVSVGKPMSKEEIYGHIVERSLFQFGAKNPVNVLNVELNRHCEGTDYSQSASSKLFSKSKTGQFFVLGASQKELKEWLVILSESNPQLAELCLSHNIFNEESYFENKQLLSDYQIKELEIIRYQQLKKLISKKDPSKLIAILPSFILESSIEKLDFPVRTSNVFSAQNICQLKDIIGLSLENMLAWPNFGKTSAKDLYEALDTSVEKFTTNLIDFRGHLSGSSANWLKVVTLLDSELAEKCLNTKIYDEKSYFENKHLLDDSQIRQLELIRYKELRKSINVQDPSELIPILPISILEAHITQLGLTVRTTNVFHVQKIFKLKDALGYSFDDMMSWDNFGKKSAKDLCVLLDSSVKKLSNILPVTNNSSIPENVPFVEGGLVKEAPDTSNFDYISQTPLKEHFENSLSSLKENERKVLENRTGYHGPVKTLEEVGEMIGVTRERVRQIQKKNVAKIISTEFWDDCIAIKIGEMLLNREQPLYLEMLEIEDAWFKGFIGNYQHLAAIIELFSENEIRVIKIDSAMVVSRIHQDDWDTMISHYRKSLREKANEQTWSKSDTELTFKASLEEKGASELYPLLWRAFADVLIFEDSSSGRELLISYGKTLNSAIFAVLHQAESPLHFSIIGERVREHLGKNVTDPQVNSGLHKVGAKLFDRGIYGLPHFNPISEGTCQHLRVVIESLVLNGPLMKQWHTTEFLNILEQKFPTLPDELNQYILNLILESSEQLTYLNKNVWARYDSNQSSEDRVDMADAFSKILEDAGTPLKGKELIKRLEGIRGVNDKLQLQATDRMIQVGPDTWGLYERDISLTSAEIECCLDSLYSHLTRTQRGIHHSEVEIFLIENSLSHLNVSGYELLNLAQRDNRFYLGRSLFLGLAEWGEDTRRLNVSQAVRKVVSEMQSPMSTVEINVLVEKLTGLEIDGTLTGIIPKEGGKYNPETRLWEKVLSE